MSSRREASSQRYARLHNGAAADNDPRDEEPNPRSVERQARELACTRAQALNFRHLADAELPPLAWLCHQLVALGRKSGVAC